MSIEPPPLDTLLELVDADASGELVCVSKTFELHVYLQSGRIAWATDSTRPFAFSRHLLAHTSLTREAFQEVLETCRRDRLPLGETLIAWNLASLADIRAALEHQIEGALSTLASCTHERTIFLAREQEYASYDARLTFDALSLIPEPISRRVVLGTGASRQTQARGHGLLEGVRHEVPNAAWLEVLAGTAVVERFPYGFEPLVPPQVLEHTLLDGADLVAVRTARGTLLGVTLPDERQTLWCRLDVDTAFGSTLSTLTRIAGHEPASTRDGEPRRAADGAAARDVVVSVRPTTAARTREEDESAVTRFLARAPEIEGALVVERHEITFAAARAATADGGPSATWMMDVVGRRARVLDVLLTEPSASNRELEELGYRLKSMVTGEAHGFCFGAELVGGPKRSLWLFTSRASAQGLGWAYLTSLARQLGAAENADGRAAAG